jgi:leucyl/phenylalanyl-tRNA--protein transferase
VILGAHDSPRFPDPNWADAHGLVAAGGSLSPEWLLTAYERGIFPWYDESMPILWWSPDPRAVMDDRSLHVSRSMQRFAKSTRFRLTFNRAFEEVMRGCAENRDDGTWILPDMLEAYVRLNELGHAFSVEAWSGDRLVGGLYGVQRGALFAAESMFHRETNASKWVLLASVRSLFARGIEVFDVQFSTPHLASLGAYEISRREYLERVAKAVQREVDLRDLAIAFDA